MAWSRRISSQVGRRGRWPALITTIPHRLIGRLPAGIRAHPIEFLLIALCLGSGVTSLLGDAASSPVAAVVHPAVGTAWSVVLTVGAAAWLWGLLGVREHRNTAVYTRVAVYRLGLHLLSSASVVYTLAIILGAHGSRVALQSWPILLLAAMTYVRAVALTGERDPG